MIKSKRTWGLTGLMALSNSWAGLLVSPRLFLWVSFKKVGKSREQTGWAVVPELCSEKDRGSSGERADTLGEHKTSSHRAQS